jgi:uncharacterized membrane protein
MASARDADAKDPRPDAGPARVVPGAPTRTTRGGRWTRWIPWLLLAAFVLAFGVFSYSVAWASYSNLAPGGVGGSTDLSIMMQALSSTNHGYIPFYEAPDCMHGGRCSLLLVHPALVLYGLAPVYALDASPALLFGLQSIGVALAAVPLFLLARDLSGSRWKGLLAASVYLVFLPTISAIDFSFHIEPFLPLELFTLFWLWRDGHYWTGAALAIVALLTFDVNSVLIFFFGVFFLWPFVVTAARELIGSIRRRAGAPPLGRAFVGQLRRLLWSPGARAARAALLLMVVALVGYVSLRLFVENSTAFGLPALPPQFHLPVGRPNPQVTGALTFGGSASNWVLYWLFCFALLGFVGLLVPRTLWLAVPWLGYTALATSPNYTTLGFHYGSIVAVPLLIGFAYGLAKLPLGRPPAAASDRTRTRYQVRRAAAWTIVAVVLAVNVALTPVGPLATPLANSALPVSGQYPSSLAASSDAHALQALGALVPQFATALTPYLLYPFVANDIYAYPYPGSTKTLPFPVPTLPTYVLTDPTDLGSLPSNVRAAIANPSDYGARAEVPSTPIGLVTLYERSYHGAIQSFGPGAQGPP